MRRRKNDLKKAAIILFFMVLLLVATGQCIAGEEGGGLGGVALPTSSSWDINGKLYIIESYTLGLGRKISPSYPFLGWIVILLAIWIIWSLYKRLDQEEDSYFVILLFFAVISLQRLIS